MQIVLAVCIGYNHGKDTCRTGKIGESGCCCNVILGLCNELAAAHIAFGAVDAVGVFFHEDALPVVAVGVGKRIVALGDGFHLVETGVGYVLFLLGDNAEPARGFVNGMGLGVDVVPRIGENDSVVRHLLRHAPIRVIFHRARYQHATLDYLQAVKVVIFKMLFQVACFVFTES